MSEYRIKAWSAKRASDSITIVGTGASGERIKLTRIKSIEAGEDGPVAIQDNGAHGQTRVLLA